MQELLILVGAVLVAATALPVSRLQQWWVRVLDFPRLQVACGLVLVLGLHLSLVRQGPGAWAFRGVLLAALLVQLRRIRPYTRLARRQVERTSLPAGERDELRLMFSNVLQTNRQAPLLLAAVREADPDLVLALEADDWWRRELSPLAATHPFTVLQAQENTYGMLLYSRLELQDVQVRFIVEDDVPSIHARVVLRSGRTLRLHCLHPRPPAPQEADSSKPRDAELLIVGREVEREPGPTVVMGDLNDVAWSHTSDLFRECSGLLDPRVGRGMYNTFHAHHRLLRFPLDHFFHSNDFRLIDFRRLGDVGSDHFPVLISLSYEPDAKAAQPEPQAEPEDRAEQAEKIAAATTD